MGYGPWKERGFGIVGAWGARSQCELSFQPTVRQEYKQPSNSADLACEDTEGARPLFLSKLGSMSHL